MVEDAEAKEVFARAEEHFAKTGFPPALGANLWSSDAMSSFTLVSGSDVAYNLPKHDPRNPAHRAAVANLIAQLRRTEAIITRPGDLPASESLLLGLQTYLVAGREKFPPRTVPVLRWELQAAAVAVDLEAVIDIGSTWMSVDREGDHIHLLARTLFLLVGEVEQESGTREGAWDSELANEETLLCSLANALAFVKATRVDDIPDFLSRDISRAEHAVREHVMGSDLALCVDHDAERLLTILRRVPRLCLSYFSGMQAGRLRQLPVESAIAGWCEYAAAELENMPGLFLDAAERFSEVSESKALEALSIEWLRADAHAAAASCYAKACRWSEAESHARERIRLEPKDVRARERLAQFLYRQERYSEAVQAFADYVTNLDDSQGESWSASFLLKLGLESLTNRDLTVAIESAAFGSPFREQGRRLVGWMAPWTEHLVKTAADKWWTGLWILSDDGAGANLGEAAVREAAGAAFGEAINLQIRECIAGPFAAAIGDLRPPDDYWTKFLKQSATLGEQLNCLRQTTGGNHEMARQLGKWIANRFPALPEYLRRKGSTLPTLAELRGGAAHRVIAAPNLRRLYNEAATLLEKIPAPQVEPSDKL